MTNAEIVASFMEERPTCAPTPGFKIPIPTPHWWGYGQSSSGETIWAPYEFTLDRLRLVEERLTIEQCRDYDILLDEAVTMQSMYHPEAFVWHASAEQKLAALAEVLRAGVEKGERG